MIDVGVSGSCWRREQSLVGSVPLSCLAKDVLPSLGRRVLWIVVCPFIETSLSTARLEIGGVVRFAEGYGVFNRGESFGGQLLLLPASSVTLELKLIS